MYWFFVAQNLFLSAVYTFSQDPLFFFVNMLCVTLALLSACDVLKRWRMDGPVLVHWFYWYCRLFILNTFIPPFSCLSIRLQYHLFSVFNSRFNTTREDGEKNTVDVISVSRSMQWLIDELFHMYSSCQIIRSICTKALLLFFKKSKNKINDIMIEQPGTDPIVSTKIVYVILCSSWTLLLNNSCSWACALLNILIMSTNI